MEGERIELKKLDYHTIENLLKTLLERIEIDYGLETSQIGNSIGFSNTAIDVIVRLSKYSQLIVINRLLNKYEYNFNDLINSNKHQLQIDKKLINNYRFYSQKHVPDEQRKCFSLFNNNIGYGELSIEENFYTGEQISLNTFEFVVRNSQRSRIQLKLDYEIKRLISQNFINGIISFIRMGKNSYNEKCLLIRQNIQPSKKLDKAVLQYLYNDTFHERMDLKDIETSVSFISYIKKSLENSKYFTIQLPEELTQSYFHYLEYFSIYIEKTKKKEIVFDVKRKDKTHISIHFETQENISRDDMKIYLNEYHAVMTSSEVDLNNVIFEKKLNDKDLNFLLLELRNQNRFLQSSLEIAQLKNHLLEKAPIRITEVNNQVLSRTRLSSNELKYDNKFFKQMIRKGKIDKCIEVLNELDELGRIKDQDSSTDLISLSAINQNINRDYHKSIISHEEYMRTKNKITNGLISIIKDVSIL